MQTTLICMSSTLLDESVIMLTDRCLKLVSCYILIKLTDLVTFPQHNIHARSYSTTHFRPRSDYSPMHTERRLFNRGEILLCRPYGDFSWCCGDTSVNQQQLPHHICHAHHIGARCARFASRHSIQSALSRRSTAISHLARVSEAQGPLLPSVMHHNDKFRSLL